MEKYKILIKRSVEKDLQKIPKKDVTKILKIIEALADNPYPSNVKKLSHGEKYRIRFRQYRILYQIENYSRQNSCRLYLLSSRKICNYLSVEVGHARF